MKGFFFIIAVGLIFCSNIHAQNNKNSIDSLRAVNKAKTDSVKAINQAKRDSIAALKSAREEARKAAGKKKKNKLKRLKPFILKIQKTRLLWHVKKEGFIEGYQRARA
jgi:hypothetical protein